MDKCYWKNGIYKPCEKMAKQIIDDVTEKGSFILSDYTECGCGGDLKPEEKPLIDPQDIKPGLYTVYWESGGTSLAAIGIRPNGNRWLAPTNWMTSTEDQDIFNDITKIELICIQESE